jgi:cytochrome c553
MSMLTPMSCLQASPTQAAVALIGRCLLAVALGLAFARALAAEAGMPSVPAPLAEDAMGQRMQACVVCHGKQGRATNAGYFPRIAGKPAGYLLNQLHNFREGRRQNAAMAHLLRPLSDDYLQEIATYFSGLDLPYPPPQVSKLSVEQARTAERLVAHGDPDRRIPACVSCHGSHLAGRLPAMPGLLGLPADYLIGQLGAWRTGQRRAQSPDCMADIARRLSPEEVGVVARWLSAQTLPVGTRPAPQSASPLPLRCGSGQP